VAQVEGYKKRFTLVIALSQKSGTSLEVLDTAELFQ
jgi:hypothetical protein